MIKEYICKFQQGKKVDYLIFDIMNNPISAEWSKLVEYHISKGEDVPLGILNSFVSNEDSLKQEILNLCNIIGLTTPKKLDQNTLNDLHAKFHFLEEQNTMESSKQQSYHDLNTAIHRLELIYKYSKYKSFKWYINQTKSPLIEIDNDYWKYYSVKFLKYIKPHGLYLGYHTIGKDILSTYKDRDIDLVKVNGVRQPEFFSTETLYQPQKGFRINKTLMIKRWLKNNNCEHLINFDLPKYKFYQSFPRIGNLRLTKTQAEIENLFSNYTMIKVDIA